MSNSPKTLEELEKELDAAFKEYKTFHKRFYFEHYQCKSITCKGCKSRLTLSFLKGNKCPVCRTDLRPQSAIDRERWLKERVYKLNDECIELENMAYSEEKEEVML